MRSLSDLDGLVRVGRRKLGEEHLQVITPVPMIDEILEDADAALAAALEPQGRERLGAMRRFMHVFERIGREVASGNATWAQARPWALRASERLVSAKDALAAWETEMAEVFYHGGEEEAERALSWRSQHALALELFRDTPARDLLASQDDEEVDEDFRKEAERIGVDAPGWVPRSHDWWRWPDWRLQRPVVAEVATGLDAAAEPPGSGR